jgi:triacylglycerol lipase
MKKTWLKAAALVGLALLAFFWLISPPAAPSASTSSSGAPRYPIVLVHGMVGFAELDLGLLGKQPYWRGIDTALRAQNAKVYVAQVSAFNASEVRGEQLLAQVAQILRDSGAEKVNLIGHSQGSQTSRYVAAKHPEWVASVTSVAGPNAGSEFADWLHQQVKQETWAAAFILALGRGTGHVVRWAAGGDLPEDPRAVLASLTSEGAADFNRRFSAGMPTEACGQGEALVDGVRYFSWSGIGAFRHAGNVGDYAMYLTGLAFKQSDNDGLVGRCSSHLGQVIRDDYPMNHLHVVNQLFGLVGEGADPVATYVAHAQRLHDLGL